MDTGSIEKVVTCNVCFEMFDKENRRPKILPCGHTFCHSCIQNILLQSPLCPTCKAQIQTLDVMLIPVNFYAESMLSVLKHDIPNDVQSHSSMSRRPRPISMNSESVEICSEHSYPKEFRCMDCEYYICSVCGMLNHKQCRTLLIKEAYKELKVQVSQKVEKELLSWKSVNDSTAQSLESLEEDITYLLDEIKVKENTLKERQTKVREIQSLKSEDLIICENLKHLRYTIENSSDDNDFLKTTNEIDTLTASRKVIISQLGILKVYWPLPLTIEALQILCESTSINVVENGNLDIYGKVKVIDGQIWISCFEPEKPKGPLFPFKEFLARFSGSSELPKKVFLKLVSTSKMAHEVDVVIETDGTYSRGKNFILLCSGFKGKNYKEQLLRFVGGVNYYHLCDKFSFAVEEITNGGPTIFPNEGVVVGRHTKDSWFLITTTNISSSQRYPLIGFVISGLQKLQKLNHCGLTFQIADCGLVI